VSHPADSPAVCPACGAQAPAGARFCPACGRALQPAGAAERKLATVLFADLAGSTELAGRLDAEVLRGLLAEVYDQLSWAAAAYGGTVEKFIGDAVMCVFGVPAAHEDDPERAIRAALLMRSRMAGMRARSGVDVQLRIGINTGLVATGTSPGRDFLVTGEPVNLAARLQQAADPGEILVGERTFRSAEPVVRTVVPRQLSLRGHAGQVTAYSVERLAPVRGYRRRRRPYGPFVGRVRELLLIRSLVEGAVEHGRAQLITVVGEPGIGKSRLVEEAVVELQRGADPPSVLVARCLPYGEQNPFAPLRELLLRSAAVREADSRDQARAKVERELKELLGPGEEAAEVLRMAASQPGEPGEDDESDPERGRTAWQRLLLALARRQPLMLVIEDAHWAEPALLELLGRVVGGAARVPLAVVCVARDELLQHHPTWGTGARNETTITLDALDDADMSRLAMALAAADPPREAIAQAGGNPFFLEEILAMTGEGAAMAVPETVQGVIAARIDLLERADKTVLQQAAVIGRVFDPEALAVLGDDGQLGRRLRALVDRDMVIALPAGGHAFKHALIRDVAYESLARAERGRLHLALARHLDATGASRHLVAGHLATAVELGRLEARADAVAGLLAAAAEARSVHAHGSAMRHAARALELAAGDREQALAHEAVGDAHWMAEQPADAWAAYGRGLHLADSAGLDRSTMARLRWKYADLPTRWGAGKGRADLDEVARQIELGLDDARAADEPEREARLLISRALLVWPSHGQEPPGGATLDGALADAAAALAIGERLDRPAIVSAALDAQGVTLGLLGRPAQAREAAERRFALVGRIPGREEQIDACSMAASSRTATGAYAEALEAADTARGLAAGDSASWLAWPMLWRADACFWWDRWDDALAAYERFLTTYRSAGARRSGRPPWRAAAMAAAVHLLRGEREQADALEQRTQAGESGWLTTALSHALLGAGEPDEALARLPRGGFARYLTVAIEAEATAMLSRWYDLDRLLAEADALPGVAEAPRVAAQLDRARAVAGDELALQRATAGFQRLGCVFEHARCLELAGDTAAAARVYRRLGAAPALHRLGGRAVGK
jgi:class 3 adenylate cyclase